ncbi:YrhK family protein [Pokkaliibacter sp. CJK22405]|uniref:YrhK family protein n=1 Tax=Pokkaliibacter sp. CJK22405 TaxID=3384615 RepID=UPI00398539C7
MKRTLHDSGDFIFTFGHDEIIIHRRYLFLSTLNDLMIGIWFVIGSFCFFYEGEIQTIGVWLFVIGSVQLVIRPCIRIARSIHLKHLPEDELDH